MVDSGQPESGRSGSILRPTPPLRCHSERSEESHTTEGRDREWHEISLDRLGTGSRQARKDGEATLPAWAARLRWNSRPRADCSWIYLVRRGAAVEVALVGVAAGAGICAIPLSDTVSGLGPVSVAIVRVPLRVPAFTGAKATLMMQCERGATEPAQLLPATLKSPLALIPVTCSVPLSMLFSDTVLTVLTVPTFCGANEIASGTANTLCPGSVPVPESDTVCGYFTIPAGVLFTSSIT
jgi:hypothetical protein